VPLRAGSSRTANGLRPTPGHNPQPKRAPLGTWGRSSEQEPPKYKLLDAPTSTARIAVSRHGRHSRRPQHLARMPEIRIRYPGGHTNRQTSKALRNVAHTRFASSPRRSPHALHRRIMFDGHDTGLVRLEIERAENAEFGPFGIDRDIADAAGCIMTLQKIVQRHGLDVIPYAVLR